MSTILNRAKYLHGKCRILSRIVLENANSRAYYRIGNAVLSRMLSRNKSERTGNVRLFRRYVRKSFLSLYYTEKSFIREVDADIY